MSASEIETGVSERCPDRDEQVRHPLPAAAVEFLVCASCRGFGWKYVVRRSAMRVMAYTCERADASFRRPCLDCGGSGKQSRPDVASRRAKLAPLLSPGSQQE
ncbi:hypothetical protein JCM9534A_30090 [Catenuloplanes indicus JCM 9534]|uniref:DnaJ-class molecular chaperone n=1 Tax=Catenuloplanes indicus TaxID=137267 RepID=A0AAE3VZU5_9ACTN|nr:DnaJ-class molecular chaperone [Catenuloplanes indicus]